MAAAVPYILMAAGAATGAMGSIRAGQAEARAGALENAQDQANAQQTRTEASMQMDDQRRSARAAIGTELAATSQSGVQLGGSAADVLRQSLFNAEADTANIRYAGETKARGYENAGQMALFTGKLKKDVGYLTAASQLLTAGGQMFSMGKSSGGSSGGSK